MPKINVYLPDALADRVREAELPVSAICQDALEREVQLVEAIQKSAGKAEKIAARLKGTTLAQASDDFREGFSIGQKWAESTATEKELRTIAETTAPDWTFIPLEDHHSLAHFINKRYGEWNRGFDLQHQVDIHRGVVAGAHEVWKQVASLL